MEPKINVLEPSACKRIIEISIPVEKTEEERAKALKKLRKLAAVPGFRPGKAPDAMLERYYHKAIVQEIMESSVSTSLESALQDLKITPIGEPQLVKSDFDLGKPLEMVFEVEIVPSFELKDYTGLEVPHRRLEFDEAAVDRELEHLREHYSTREAVTDQPAQTGDLMRLDMEFTPEGESEPLSLKSIFFQKGEAGPNDFLDSILADTVAEDEKPFSHEFPADYYDPRIAGKSGQGTVKVVSIQRRRLPELDDELARKTGKHETIEALREEVAQGLRRSFEEQSRQAMETAVLDRLVDDYDFAVPEHLVNAAFRDRTNDTVQYMLSRGISEKDIKGIDWGRAREKDDPSLRRSVRRMLIVDKIAEKEGITISDEDVEKKIAERAAENDLSVEELRKHLVKDEHGMDHFKERLRIEKAIEKVIGSARFVDPPTAPAPSAETAEAEAAETTETAE